MGLLWIDPNRASPDPQLCSGWGGSAHCCTSAVKKGAACILCSQWPSLSLPPPLPPGAGCRWHCPSHCLGRTKHRHELGQWHLRERGHLWLPLAVPMREQPGTSSTQGCWERGGCALGTTGIPSDGRILPLLPSSALSLCRDLGHFAKGAAVEGGCRAVHHGHPSSSGGPPQLGPHPWAWGHPEPPEAPSSLALAQSASLDLDLVFGLPASRVLEKGGGRFAISLWTVNQKRNPLSLDWDRNPGVAYTAHFPTA